MRMPGERAMDGGKRRRGACEEDGMDEAEHACDKTETRVEVRIHRRVRKGGEPERGSNEKRGNPDRGRGKRGGPRKRLGGFYMS